MLSRLFVAEGSLHGCLIGLYSDSDIQDETDLPFAEQIVLKTSVYVFFFPPANAIVHRNTCKLDG